MRNGVVVGMPAEEYHSGEEFSKSQLSVARKSPALLRRQRSGVERVETAAMKRGTAAHAISLEPELFAKDYALPFEPSVGALKTIDDMKQALERAGVAFKASAKKGEFESLCREHGLPLYSDELEAFNEREKGKVILTLEQWQRAHNMGAAMMTYPLSRKLLTLPGLAEVSFFWTCPKTGIRMRGRFDRILQIGVAVEVKSVGAGMHDEESFMNAVGRFDYHMQDALYCDGLALACAQGKVPKALKKYGMPKHLSFIVVAEDACVIEGEAYGVEVYTLDTETREIARLEYQETLETLKRCIDSGRWPGSSGEVREIGLPPWRKKNALARLTQQ